MSKILSTIGANDSFGVPEWWNWLPLTKFGLLSISKGAILNRKISMRRYATYTNFSHNNKKERKWVYLQQRHEHYTYAASYAWKYVRRPEKKSFCQMFRNALAPAGCSSVVKLLHSEFFFDCTSVKHLWTTQKLLHCVIAFYNLSMLHWSWFNGASFHFIYKRKSL